MKIQKTDSRNIQALVKLFHVKHTAQKLIALSNSKNQSRAKLGRKMLARYCEGFMKFTPKQLAIAVMVYNRGAEKK